MFRLKAGISIIAIIILAATAHADPVTFSLENGTFFSGATMTGTVVIDTATGSMVSADLTYTLGGSSVTFDQAFSGQFTIPALYTVFLPLTLASVFDGPNAPPAVDEFDLILPASPLAGYTGGPICTYPGGYYCGGGLYSSYHGGVNFLSDYGLGAGNDPLATGNLVPLTVTPEPSGFALTLTGALCGLAALGRFRRVQAILGHSATVTINLQSPRMPPRAV